jgi:hypothetical protein
VWSFRQGLAEGTRAAPAKLVASPARTTEVTVDKQLRRYFVGMISFGFVVTWVAVGVPAAFLGTAAAVGTSIVVPTLLDGRRARRRAAHRRAVRPRVVTSRPIADEGPEELPLVPDEPSLIIGVAD